jgi:nucleoside-diphosphate-sugar epimerase
MISCVRTGKVFETGNRDIVRDYTHPEDLYRMILACLSNTPINAVFDQYSKAPVGKFELLELFNREFGLEYRVIDTPSGPPPRGSKPVYCSTNHSAERIGFTPKYSSADAVLSETKLMLSVR